MNPSMRVMELRAFGDPEGFMAAERPVPRPEAGQVLVRVAATSVNPIDTKIRAGAVPGIAPALPAILHVDVAGTVAAVGLGVTRLREGDVVYGFAGGVKDRQGALAEYVVVPEGDLAPAPRNLPLAEVAALPVVAATAWEALFMRTVLAPGMRVLIHGGTGISPCNWRAAPAAGSPPPASTAPCSPSPPVANTTSRSCMVAASACMSCSAWRPWSMA